GLDPHRLGVRVDGLDQRGRGGGPNARPGGRGPHLRAGRERERGGVHRPPEPGDHLHGRRGRAGARRDPSRRVERGLDRRRGLPARTEFRGNPWTYTNDAAGRRLTATDPLNHTTTYTYDTGLLKTVKDAVGNVTTYLYDASRRPTGMLVGGAVTGTVGYDAAG